MTQPTPHRTVIMNTAIDSNTIAGFELRIPSLFHEGRGLAFPCDAQGHVDIDHLPLRARRNLVHALARIGREFATPRLIATAAH
jgi:hypothetical protein